MLRFGIEFETVPPQFEDVSWNGKTMPNGWIKKSDSSIATGNVEIKGVEFASPIFTWDERGMVFDQMTTLQNEGYKCNTSCGLHIHMSGTFGRWKRMIPVIKEWRKLIGHGFQSAKRRKAYCKPTFDSIFKHQLVRLVSEGDSQSHIEVRLFNAHLCKRWVHRCLMATKRLGELLEINHQTRSDGALSDASSTEFTCHRDDIGSTFAVDGQTVCCEADQL